MGQLDTSLKTCMFAWGKKLHCQIREKKLATQFVTIFIPYYFSFCFYFIDEMTKQKFHFAISILIVIFHLIFIQTKFTKK